MISENVCSLIRRFWLQSIGGVHQFCHCRGGNFEISTYYANCVYLLAKALTVLPWEFLLLILYYRKFCFERCVCVCVCVCDKHMHKRVLKPRCSAQRIWGFFQSSCMRRNTGLSMTLIFPRNFSASTTPLMRGPYLRNNVFMCMYRKHHSKAPWSLDGMSLPEPSKKLQDQYLDTCRGGTGILVVLAAVICGHAFSALFWFSWYDDHKSNTSKTPSKQSDLIQCNIAATNREHIPPIHGVYC